LEISIAYQPPLLVYRDIFSGKDGAPMVSQATESAATVVMAPQMGEDCYAAAGELNAVGGDKIVKLVGGK